MEKVTPGTATKNFEYLGVKIETITEQVKNVSERWLVKNVSVGISGFNIINPNAKLFELEQSVPLNPTSIEDNISYFENRIYGARTPEQKIRPMQQLINVMMVKILKKHCV